MEPSVEKEALIEAAPSSKAEDGLTEKGSLQVKNLGSLQEAVQGRAVAQVVNGINFAMGTAWSASLLAYIAPHHRHADEDPRHLSGHRTAFVIWSCSSIALFIALMFVSTKIIQNWQARAKEAILNDDVATAIRYRSKEMSFTTLVKWGLGSCVGGLVNQAIKANTPLDWQSHMIWFVTSVGINLSIVVILQQCLKSQGVEEDKLPTNRNDVEAADGSFLHVSCDIWFSTGALISAMAFLDFVQIWFQVEPTLSRSTDVLMLYIFSVAAVGVAGVFLAILQNADKADAIQSQHQGTIRIGFYLRKFIAKMFTLCAAVIVHFLLYVSLVEVHFKVEPDVDVHSIYDPLPLWSAAALLVSALVINLTIGLFIERSLKVVAQGLAAAPRDKVPGLVDDAVLATLQSIAQSTSASYVVAFGWLVGNAMHKFFISAWQHYLGGPAWHSDWVVSSLIYTSILTVSAILTSICFPPPPKEI